MPEQFAIEFMLATIAFAIIPGNGLPDWGNSLLQHWAC